MDFVNSFGVSALKMGMAEEALSLSAGAKAILAHKGEEAEPIGESLIWHPEHTGAAA